MTSQLKKQKAKERYKKIRDNNIQAILEHTGWEYITCNRCDYFADSFGFYDFHHIDPSTKVASISSMMGHVNTEKLLAEVDKCEILCPNCHREHHIKEQKQKEKENEEEYEREILKVNILR